MDFENILIEIEDQIGLITINRPKKLNALNKATIEELHHAFKDLDEDEDVRVIIITGAGEKAFVAGADIAEFANYSVYEGSQLAAKGQELLFNQVERMQTPVIAAINGFALGGSLENAVVVGENNILNKEGFARSWDGINSSSPTQKHFEMQFQRY